jgi:hypothetical protein
MSFAANRQRRGTDVQLSASRDPANTAGRPSIVYQAMARVIRCQPLGLPRFKILDTVSEPNSFTGPY